MLDFTIGHTLVHPVHGPVVVNAVGSRQVKGQSVEYVEVSVLDTALVIFAPVDRAEEIGLRELYSPQQAQGLLDLLREESRSEEKQWSRRFKDNAERLSSGDTRLIAGMVRDLWRRREQHGLSSGEREQLEKALKPIRTELTLALGVSVEAAEAVMREAIFERGHSVHTAPSDRAALLIG